MSGNGNRQVARVGRSELRLGGTRVDLVSRNRRRRGVALVLVLSCLFVVALVGMALLRTATAQHRQLRFQQRQLQAFWLAESGLLRAAARLKNEPDYTGEIWQLTVGELAAGELAAVGPAGKADGRVEIRVTPVDGQPDRRRVRVDARYPVGAGGGVLQSRTMVLTLTTEGENE